MKSSRHIAWALLALLAAACGKDEVVPEPVIPPDDGMEEMSFTASAPVIGATSGDVGAEETYPLLWNDGDAIGVMPVYGAFDESEVQKMKFTTSIEGGYGRDGRLHGAHRAERGWIFCILSPRPICQIRRRR